VGLPPDALRSSRLRATLELPAQAEDAVALDAAREALQAAQVGLVRDVYGNPFRPPLTVEPAWLAWNGGTVPLLAQAAYAEPQLPSGSLDPARLQVLANALDEAGCEDVALLQHLRSAGPHIRGCFAVEALLGRQ
jgi:hypothetical protein